MTRHADTLARAIGELYREPAVRRRMQEYMGGGLGRRPTCAYITGDGIDYTWDLRPLPPERLDQCLGRGYEVARSLWDRKSLIVHLDLEYVNPDFPSEVYLNPLRGFRLQEPVLRAALGILAAYQIRPLLLMTGRGYHLTWRVSRSQIPFVTLGRLGQNAVAGSNSLDSRLNERLVVRSELSAAFRGLGLVVEHLAHRIRDQALVSSRVPVQLTDVAVGRGRRGRELVSIDVSEYGDPLYCRRLRLPFSVYLKPWQQRSFLGQEAVGRLSPLFALPAAPDEVARAIANRCDPDAVRRTAQTVTARIPRCGTGTSLLIADYRRSSLARFHEDYYAIEADPPETWPHTYDQLDLRGLPHCVASILDQPNDRLLKPAGIQLVTRVILSLGWHPRHISGLLRSKYEREYGWAAHWPRADRATRADFYVRLFSGLVVAGSDDLHDLNCLSTAEKGLCAGDACSFNLGPYAQAARERRACA